MIGGGEGWRKSSNHKNRTTLYDYGQTVAIFKPFCVKVVTGRTRRGRGWIFPNVSHNTEVFSSSEFWKRLILWTNLNKLWKKKHIKTAFNRFFFLITSFHLITAKNLIVLFHKIYVDISVFLTVNLIFNLTYNEVPWMVSCFCIYSFAISTSSW